ncbi:MAG TPA: glycosyltransferase, partial [Promineifilum sp.]|nr:glycosyltransferase [Promineifilum sp.]
MTRPTLSVVILNWNGRAWLEACLVALAAQEPPPDRVVLVDNGSGDDSVAFTRERFPWVTIRENGGNLGFAAGNNAALRDDTAEIVVLLNPDVVLAPGTLAALAEALAADPRIGIAGAKLWYPDGETIQHAGGFITHPQALPGHYGIGAVDAGDY